MGRFQRREATKLLSLVSMTWSGFPKGQERPLVDGGQGSAKAPLREMERRYVLMARDGVNPQTEPGPEGCNGSAQRAPLPRGRCSTPHILRVADGAEGVSKEDGAIIPRRTGQRHSLGFLGFEVIQEVRNALG